MNMHSSVNREIRLNRRQAAEYLGVSVPTLARWASKGRGPSYVLLGGKALYRIPELDAYIDSCRRDHKKSDVNSPL